MKALLQLSLLLTLLTVILSAWIRLAEVGIGCEPWPQCYAVLDPELEKRGITVLTAQGRDMAHRGARLAHRYIASTLGLLVLILFILSAKQGANRPLSMAVPGAILAITIFLSVLGYYTPTRSDPMITLGNLLGGFGMLALLAWMAQRYGETALPSAEVQSRLRPPVRVALTLVLCQVLLGAWSSANYASSHCPDLLSCEQPWFSSSALLEAYNPSRMVELDGNGRALREPALAMLSMFHRGFALLTAAYLAWMVRRVKTEPTLLRPALGLSVCSIGLLLVGVSMIWWQMPLLLVTLHNTLAAGLLVAASQLLLRLSPLPAPAVPRSSA